MPRSKGRTGRPWRRAVAITRARVEAGEGCIKCGQGIDLTLDPNHRMAFTADHIMPVHMLGPNDPLLVDPTNLNPAHRACNSADGARIRDAHKRVVSITPW